MIVSLTGEVNYKMLNSLITSLKGTDEVTVYFSSFGGYIDSMEAIISVIDSNKDRITLIGFGEIASSAFVILFKTQCKKQILSYTNGLAHLPSSDYNITSSGIPKYTYDRDALKDFKKENERWVQRHKEIGLNPKELKRLSKGEDVYISYERMQELIML